MSHYDHSPQAGGYDADPDGSNSGYGTAPYGADPHGTPTGYGAPQSYAGAPAGYVQAPSTNTMALLSLIMSLVGIATSGMTSILGIVFGHIGKNQIRRTGESGSQLAMWGLIVGYGVLGLWVLFWAAYILFFVGFMALGLFGASTST